MCRISRPPTEVILAARGEEEEKERFERTSIRCIGAVRASGGIRGGDGRCVCVCSCVRSQVFPLPSVASPSTSPSTSPPSIFNTPPPSRPPDRSILQGFFPSFCSIILHIWILIKHTQQSEVTAADYVGPCSTTALSRAPPVVSFSTVACSSRVNARLCARREGADQICNEHNLRKR